MKARIAVIVMLLCANAFAQQTTCPIAAPQLSAPADNATVGSPVTLTWTAASGAAAYRVWVSVDGSPAVVLDRTTSTSSTLAVPSGAIEWYVEALFAQCGSLFSAHRHFTIATGATCGTRKAPSLLAPATGAAISSPVTFTWTPVSNALLYRVWVSTDGGAFVDVDETKQTSLTADIGPGNIQWYVDAITESCPAISSAKSSFTVTQTSACGSVAPVPLTPADQAPATSPIIFSWTPVPNATEYRVIASVDGGDSFLLGKTASASLTRFLPPGQWAWNVVAVFDECPNTRSAKSRFAIIKALNCPTAAPQLIAPANGVQNVTSPVTFMWNAAPGAVAYAVFVRRDDGAPTPLGQTTSTQLQKKLPDGNFEWFVMALFGACPPAESAHNTFTIASPCDNARPMLMVPHDGAGGLTSPIHFAWSRTPNAKSYNVWIASDDNPPVLAGSTTDNKLTATVAPGVTSWFVEAVFASCPVTESAPSTFVAVAPPPCGTPKRPLLRAPGQSASSTPYSIRWTAVPNASSYELQEATFIDFRNATTEVISDVATSVTHTATQPTRYFYRVRAISSCTDARGAYSKITSTVVLPPSAKATIDVDAISGPTQTITLPPRNPPTTFTARADKPWVTVTPSSGTIGSSGATLTVTTDRAALRSGSNSAAVIVTYGSSSVTGHLVRNGTTSSSTPISVSVASPVAPGGKSTPPPDSLIIPAVAHSTGMNSSSYESDVRLANISSAVMRYQLNFTLSRTDGTQSGQSTTIEVNPGATLALDDILSSFFGLGTDGSNATGVLEIRTLTSTGSSSSTAPSVTVASSRTYDTAPAGTFGEFMPALPFSQFIANGSPRLSLQQLAQSSAYRTNIGLIEGAGENATVLIHVFDNAGSEVAQIPVALLPGEHRQLNSFLQANAISLAEARIEVEVTSTTGKVSAYASVVDNLTNDAYIVTPALKGSTTTSRVVLPNAEVDATSGRQTDVRVFNAGTSAVTATLAYNAPQGSTQTLPAKSVTVLPGQVVAVDNVLSGLTTAVGSVTVTTAASSSLVVTGRTYTKATTGTFGQFVPAATTTSSVGLGERTMQLLQLEDSDQFKTTIGIAETSGKAATVEISVIPPDAKAYPKVQIPLDADRSIQVPLAGFGLGNIYNARVMVKVISGSGRVSAYGSVVDQRTLDPTLVPAQ